MLKAKKKLYSVDVEEIPATKFKRHGLCTEDVAALEVECS